MGDDSLEDVIRVPIHRTMVGDTLRWSFSEDGKPTVKSIYHRLRELSRPPTVQPTDHHSWTRIWNANVWLKVKSFVWKLCARVFALKSNLAARGVPISPGCPTCEEIESESDLIAGCPRTAEVWSAMKGTPMSKAALQ